MTDLTKQLEDKKKGCGKILNFNEKNENICNEDTIYCPICKAEIAILEQAIAEMQKQRQEILDKIDKLIKSSKEDGLLYPKYRPSIEAYLEVLKDYIKKLNQPKTEQ